MKRFLIKLVKHIILIMCVFISLEIIVSNHLRKCDDRRFKQWNDIYFNHLKNDVVINGSSRAWVQYNPIILDTILHVDSYNLGINGSCIERQIVKYNTYCRVQNHTPNCLIQNIDLWTIGIKTGFEREQFFPYFYFDKKLIEDVDKYEKFSSFEKYIPFCRYLKYYDLVLTSIGVLPNEKNILCKGYTGFEKEWDGEAFKRQENIEYSADIECIKLFMDFISDVQSQGTKVIFVYAPIYIGVTNKMFDLDGMYEMFDTIAKKYDIPILDYNYDSICYDTAYFYNATHLNKKGSEPFSIKLAHDIDSLGILN